MIGCRVSRYIQSAAGSKVQEKLWEDTMEEMKKLTTLPMEFS